MNLHLSSLCRSIFFSSYLTSEGRRGAAGTGSASPSILIYNSPLKYWCFFFWFSNNWVVSEIFESLFLLLTIFNPFQNWLVHKSISCATPWQPLQQVHEGSGRCWASRLLLQPENTQFWRCPSLVRDISASVDFKCLFTPWSPGHCDHRQPSPSVGPDKCKVQLSWIHSVKNQCHFRCGSNLLRIVGVVGHCWGLWSVHLPASMVGPEYRSLDLIQLLIATDGFFIHFTSFQSCNRHNRWSPRQLPCPKEPVK